MRKILFILLFVNVLGSYSQTFVLDTTFYPFFDLTTGSIKGVTTDILERTNGKLYIAGNFMFNTSNGEIHEGLTSINRDGSKNHAFNGFLGSARFFSYSNDTLIIVSGLQIWNLPIDLSGAIQNWDWINASRKTVKCFTGVPIFFENGSSIMANGIDNSGLPCDIINPPDTFPGRHIIKVTPQGLWDSTFVPDANHEPDGFFPYDSNRILIYGYPQRFTHYNGVRVNGLCRIFLDGSLDTSFHSPLNPKLNNQYFEPHLVEEDGSFFLGGSFYLDGKNSLQTLVKLNVDGSLDSTFLNFQGPIDTSSWNIGVVRTIVKTNDNGYLVGGRFNKYQGHKVSAIAKIDSIGAIQPQFFTSSGPDSSVFFGNGFPLIIKLFKSNFGGYYVLGDFRKWDGKPSQPIVRLKLVATTALEENEILPELHIYPNPTNASVAVESDFPIREIKLFDIMGKELGIEAHSTSARKYSIDLGPLPSGVYLLSIQHANGQIISRKLVKD